jgi:hypothetical protein
VTVSEAFLMGLTYVRFNSRRLHYGLLAALSFGESFLLLFCLLCLNELCSTSCLWLVNNARVRITIGTEGKRKWNVGGHDDGVRVVPLIFSPLSFLQSRITRSRQGGRRSGFSDLGVRCIEIIETVETAK